MYRLPTAEETALALEWGWELDVAKRGYDIFDFDGTGMLEIEMISDMQMDDVSDEDAAVHANANGIPIIPVDELPSNFDRRYYGWIDTEENRIAIQYYCNQDNYYCNGNSVLN